MSLNVEATLFINNMTCVNCENTIEHALSEKKGVVSVKASYSSGKVSVTYNPNEIEIKEIEKLIEAHDYHVQSEKVEKNVITESKKTDLTSILNVAIILITLYLVLRRFGILDIIYSFPIAKEGMGYGMLFLIGVLTSVHCVAMCGGICLSQCTSQTSKSSKQASKFSAIRPSLLYNLGRVISYTAIGGLVGAIGSVVSFSGAMKGVVQILAGIFMVIMGLNLLNLFPWLRKFNPRMPKIFARKIYEQKASKSPLYIGILNGLMPCGPLQAMQLYALSTGSPIKGAIAMFLFSVGTFPLMFAFGALSSLLNKKFTGKMMTASAVLVVALGVFMFSSGASLSGLSLPNFLSTTSQAESSNYAMIKDGVQIVTTTMSSGSYEAIVVQKDIPVKWVIQAEKGTINGCNNSIIIPKYNIQKDIAVGDNIIEFTPTDSGVVPFSCWMGMIRSRITVVDDLSNTENIVNLLNVEDTKIEYQIPVDDLAIAVVSENNRQIVDITIDENGFSPAVIVVQRNLETTWMINGKNVESLSNNRIYFPHYNAQLEIVEGENEVGFYPESDFEFYIEGTSLCGYVKVVDNISFIDEKVIKEEVAQFRFKDYNTGDSGLPSCH